MSGQTPLIWISSQLLVSVTHYTISSISNILFEIKKFAWRIYWTGSLQETNNFQVKQRNKTTSQPNRNNFEHF